MASPTPVRTESPATRASRPRPRPALVAVAVLAAVGLWLTQPWLLLVDSEVDEAFPTVAGDAGSQAVPGDVLMDDERAGTAGADTGDAATGADAAADGAAASDDETATDDEPDAAAGGQDAAADAQADAPVALYSGEFTSRDHRTSGTATVYELPDGSLTLRLEDLATDNGPDLFVYLDDDAGDAPADAYDDGTNLGRLKGNVGNQNYDVPAGTDLDVLRTVVIWCDRFSSPFGTVELAPVG